ncbi:MAG: protein-L-isoaspartate(D-aspartate) O-methyltransferase [Acidobacteria bacterium]|nr:protein-L-isoaspartate(D-aspartate) O-methyltransferase [Acidobacteriota bacterium]
MNRPIELNDRRFENTRREMAESLRALYNIRDSKVLEAIKKIPRHHFVPKTFQSRAYDDDALPIGEGQTISKPSVIATMIQSLQLRPEHSILEIGTGSGYQTALLAMLTKHVYSLERLNSLTLMAKKNLEQLEITNITAKTFDGTYGWPDRAPFDAIIVSAAAPEIPEKLIKQLTNTGRMICPVGNNHTQILRLIKRFGAEYEVEEIGYCRFVPLVGKYGWNG